MAKGIHSQYSFTSGELSPRYYARGDYNPYNSGLKKARNCFCTVEGPVIRRAGSEFMEETKDSSKESALIPFVFNNEGDALVLEFGDNYIRFHRDGLLLGGPLEVTTPYSASEVADISYQQFGNFLYLAHPDHPPAVLKRTNNTSWALEDVSLSPPPTYEAGDSPSTTITPSAASGTSVNFTTGSGFWLDADIGRQIQHLEGAGIAVVRSITSTTVVVADIIEDFPNTSSIAGVDWVLDLSPICKVDPDGSAVGSIIEIEASPVNPPEVENGNFTNSSSGWFDTSTGTGTSSWDSSRRELKLEGSGATDVGAAEQPVTGKWIGNFTLQFDNTQSVGYKIGTSSGGSDVASGTKSAAINNEVTFSLSNGQDTIYIGFTNDSGTTYIDNVELSTTVDAFKSSDVGRYLILNGGVTQIQSLTSAAKVEALVVKSLNNTDTAFTFTIEDPTWSSTRGYPSSVTIFQERLVLAATTQVPTGVWMSETGIFNGFGRGPDDEDSISIELDTGSVKWLIPNRDLIAGASDKEIGILGSATGSALTPTNIRQVPRTFHGSDTQNPISINNELVFIQAGGKKIRTMAYDFVSDGFQGNDLLFRATHIVGQKVTLIAYSESPDNILYAITGDGELLYGTYNRQEKVIAWTKGTTDGTYESLAVIPNDGEDEAYVVVNRTIDGSTKRYIERFTTQDVDSNLSGYSDSYGTYNAPVYISNITQADPGVVTTASSHGFSNNDPVKMFNVGGMTSLDKDTFYVSNKTSTTFELVDEFGNNVDTSGFDAYTSGGEVHKLVTTISGLTYLEGETVQIKADGATHPDKTVSSGSITLDRPSYNVVAGLEYTSTITTLSPQFSLGAGTMFSQRQRRPRVAARIYKSAVPELNGNFVPTRTPSDPMGQTVPLFSGYVEYADIPWSDDANVTITTDKPLPFQLQGIFSSIEGNII